MSNIRAQWPSALRLCEQIGRFMVQTPLDPRLGLGTQPGYEASGDLLVTN